MRKVMNLGILSESAETQFEVERLRVYHHVYVAPSSFPTPMSMYFKFASFREQHQAIG